LAVPARRKRNDNQVRSCKRQSNAREEEHTDGKERKQKQHTAAAGSEDATNAEAGGDRETGWRKKGSGS
jgi:hypothetical protein